ncbi:MAG: alpha-glucosidase, partial [Cypionkella sp.]
ICLWQGEELGQTDTELGFEELTDPQGINFWPEPIGRDNTRTPMVWDATTQGGFTGSNVKPWLPVKPPQLARNVVSQAGVAGSVLESYRAMLAFRRDHEAMRLGATRFFDVAEPVLAFTRGDGVLCVFNLSPQVVAVKGAGFGALIGPSQGVEHRGDSLMLGPNAYGFMAVTGEVSLA